VERPARRFFARFVAEHDLVLKKYIKNKDWLRVTCSGILYLVYG
jgi:hypothetical protein